MNILLVVIFFLGYNAADESLYLEELKAKFSDGFGCDELEDNLTIPVLKEESFRLNVSTQELIDNCRDLLDILIQRDFESVNVSVTLSKHLAYFDAPINNTQQLLEYFQDNAPQFYHSILWRRNMIEEKMRRYLGREATEFVEWASNAFAQMSNQNGVCVFEDHSRRVNHGRTVLDRLKTLSEDAQKEVKIAFPFWTIQKFPLHVFFTIEHYLGLYMMQESHCDNTILNNN